MKNFDQPGDVMTVTASAGGETSNNLIVAAPLPVLDPIGTVMKSAGTLVATGRMWLNGVAVVAAGA